MKSCMYCELIWCMEYGIINSETRHNFVLRMELFYMIRVLMVCHGNICRSPMAEFVMKTMAKEMGCENKLYVASAATSTEEIWNGVGNPVYPPAKEELARHGISCEGKRAVQLKKQDYANYDYIIGMDSANMRNIKRIIGTDTENKVYKLLDISCSGRDVADPWYTGDFGTTYNDVVEGCSAFLEKLKKEGKI